MDKAILTVKLFFTIVFFFTFKIFFNILKVIANEKFTKSL
jgi:hypothetical protein